MTRYIARRLLAMIPLLLGDLSLLFAAEHLARRSSQHHAQLQSPYHTRCGDHCPAAGPIWTGSAPDDSISHLSAEPAQRRSWHLHVYPAACCSHHLGTDAGHYSAGAGSPSHHTAVAIPLGVISAVKQYSWIDHLCLVGSLLGYQCPVLAGPAPNADLFPEARWLPFPDGLPSQRIGRCAAAPDHACLYPGIWHGSIAGQGYLLQHAGGLGPRLHPDCPAKGLHDKLVVYRHALRNAFIPILTVSGMQFDIFWAARSSSRLSSAGRASRLAVNSIMNRTWLLYKALSWFSP